ncbi:MAG: hypothetical protein KatS3mg085_075 [Candidatus Dojkabacteria bacterium]|nr:MAG: hypothetical protein KatS3mg085_075 [Candidatus Dojkabacteria bacterium]
MGENDFNDVTKKIKNENFDSVHIQYHSGAYYSSETLDKLLSDLQKLNIKIILELHAVRSDTFDLTKSCKNLSLADKIIVHNKNDQVYMSKKLNNVVFIPLGEKLFYPRAKFKVKKDLGLSEYYPIIGTHGLFNKNKNIPTGY